MFEMIARLAPGWALAAGLLAILLVAGPGPLYKAGLLSLPLVFAGLKYGAFVGLGAGGIGIVAILARFATGHGSFVVIVLGLVFGIAAVGFVENFRRQASAVPPIHDITTDTDNPPQFVAAVHLREAAGAVNPPNYVGNEPEPGDTGRTIREAQLAFYTDLGPLFLDADPNFAFTSAITTVQDMGWDMVEASTEEGRIEAVATTYWYGFKDDIVIRITSQPDGTARVDVRSKSRVGVSDVGANAARIQEFLTALEAATGG